MSQIVETAEPGELDRRGRDGSSSSRPLRPVHHRDVGAIQLLRDAGPPGALPDQGDRARWKPDALNIYAIYTGLVYLTPLIGGRLADRYLGQRKAVFIGGILMALGQFALTQRELLYLGLGLLIVGNGFFKPNISTMVGTLYPQGDRRRDGAYTHLLHGNQPGCVPVSPGLRSAGREDRLGLWFRGGRSWHDPRTADLRLHPAIAAGQRASSGGSGHQRRSARPRDWIEIGGIAMAIAALCSLPCSLGLTSSRSGRPPG